MTDQTIDIIYNSYRIPVRLCDYHAVTLSDNDRTTARKQADTAPEGERDRTYNYLLQAAFVEHVSAGSTLRVPDALAHERALAMARSLQHRLEADNLSLDGYLEAMKTTKDDIVKDFEKDAKQQLRQRIVLLAVAQKEGLMATDADYAAEVERLKESYGIPTTEELVGFLSGGESELIRQDISVSHAAELMAELVQKQE